MHQPRYPVCKRQNSFPHPRLQPTERLVAQHAELHFINLAVGKLTLQREHQPLKRRFRRLAPRHPRA